MWPPSRLRGVKAFSRLTREPGFNALSVVRSMVSFETSAANEPSPNPVTVRHAPLTAILSPSRTSPKSSVELRMPRRHSPSRNCRSVTSPNASIMPVNMAFLFGLPIDDARSDTTVTTDHAYINQFQPDMVFHLTQPRQPEQRQRIAAQQLGAHIDHQLIDQPRLNHRAAQRRPGLQQHLVAQVVARQPTQD